MFFGILVVKNISESKPKQIKASFDDKIGWVNYIQRYV